ncbi:MAG: hypothetical protein JWM40_1798 [Frankiales bacterium]|nr:hypothetical protein [Frankiales bacterium]
MPRLPRSVELRRGVLAVSVLCDLDIAPDDLGVALPGEPDVWIPWGDCRRALMGHHPESSEGHERLGRWLLTHRWAANLPVAEFRTRLRPLGLPIDHLLHPGLDWVRRRVLGDALDLGLGAVGIDPSNPEAVIPLPQPLVEDAFGLDAEVEWLAAESYLNEMGLLAAERLPLEDRGQLRRMGDCDVVTLLGSWHLREAIADSAGGLGAIAVPMRDRGWTKLALIDPAFCPAAAAATPPRERGFERPLLITADELTQASPGGRPAALALRERGIDEPWLASALYR